MVVSQLFNQSRSSQDDSKLHDLFESDCVVFIKKLPVLTNTPQDKWIWTKFTSGEFSIKSAYRILCNNANLGSSNPIWELIWKSHIHERLKMFLWRISSNLLLTKDNLDRFIDAEDQLCPLCKIEQESIVHIFLHCPVAKALWFGSCRGIKSTSLPINSGTQLTRYILNPQPSFYLI